MIISLSDTLSFNFASLFTNSHTESSLSAEHGPMITTNLSYFPVKISRISSSRFALIAFNLSDNGYSFFRSAGNGGGEEGVKLYIDKLGAELKDAMQMCGAHSVSEIKEIW